MPRVGYAAPSARAAVRTPSRKGSTPTGVGVRPRREMVQANPCRHTLHRMSDTIIYITQYIVPDTLIYIIECHTTLHVYLCGKAARQAGFA